MKAVLGWVHEGLPPLNILEMLYAESYILRDNWSTKRAHLAVLNTDLQAFWDKLPY